jgi:large subunit ribosomal protein L24
MKVKKGDKVKVLVGKYKGKEGVVLKTFPKKQLIIVEGVNVRKKSLKKNAYRFKNDSSDNINDENFKYILRPIHVSNVKVIETVNNMKDSGDSES